MLILSLQHIPKAKDTMVP